MLRRVYTLLKQAALINQEIIVFLKDLYKDFISHLGKKIRKFGMALFLSEQLRRQAQYIYFFN